MLRPALVLTSSTKAQPADGREHLVASFSANHLHDLQPEELHITGVPDWRLRLEATGRNEVGLYLRTPVQPGKLSITIKNEGSQIALPLTLLPDNADPDGDGTPDWMVLHSAEDRRSFRRWFLTLVDRAADISDAQLSQEITDCASLLRYAYRETVRAHDDKWYAQFPVAKMPSLPSVKQWTYPNTPLGTGLFRTHPGPFLPRNLTDGTFAQFADAKTLHADNTYRLSRDLHMARPGDLIFYRLLETDSQYHSMVITGEQGEWVVYHTGPIHEQRGEMRRMLLDDLLHHPDPRWRPIASNPNFLGIYRWNILREE